MRTQSEKLVVFDRMDLSRFWSHCERNLIKFSVESRRRAKYSRRARFGKQLLALKNRKYLSAQVKTLDST